jgi:hypothetical protein
MSRNGMEPHVSALGEAACWRRGLGATLHGSAVVLLYAALAFVLFYPLFRDPAHTVLDVSFAGPDIRLNIWALAWVWHALTTDPLSLFNGNIFYPAPYALCGSEHMLGHQLVFGPIYALSGNPVLGHQLNLLLSFALCGAAMYALLRHWGVAHAASLFGGFVYAFCPIRSYSMAHVQLLAGQYLPLALVFLDATLVTGRARAAAGFCCCLVIQLLTSYYLAYMCLAGLFGYGVGVIGSRRHICGRGAILAGAAVLVACFVTAGLSYPYLRLRSVGMIPDFATDQSNVLLIGSAGAWRNYLVPPIALREWGAKSYPGILVYVGFLPLCCAVMALLPRRKGSDGKIGWAVLGSLGIAVTCYVLALGPKMAVFGSTVSLPYALAVRLIPGFSSMRVPSRFGLVLMLGFASLAGLGLNRLLGLIQRSVARRIIGSSVLLAVTIGTAVEYDLWNYDWRYRRVRTGAVVPGVYKVLAALPSGPVLEVPAGALHGEIEGMYPESEAMLYSTFHWRPLLNGISGYEPLSYAPIMTLARQLPDPGAARLLTRLTGLRYVVVHSSGLPAAELARWRETAAFRLLETVGGDFLFGVEDPPPADLLPRLIDLNQQGETVLGTPLTAVPESERRAEISLVQPAPLVVGAQRPFRLELQIANRSGTTWPALAAVRDEKIVTVAYRFESEDRSLVSQDLTAARLPYDLAPGDSVRVAVRVFPPGPGLPRRLLVGLAQSGAWFPGRLGPLPIGVTP